VFATQNKPNAINRTETASKERALFDPQQNQAPEMNSQQPNVPVADQANFVSPGPDSNSKVAKAVLITVAIFVGLGIIGVGIIGIGTWYLAKSVHAVPSATFTESDLGIAIYPGAEPSLRGSRAEIAGKTMFDATYFTTDSMDKVIAFYNSKAGPTAHLSTTTHGSGFRLSKTAGDVTTVQVMRVPDESGGKTYIKIVHVTETVGSH
jgi:hypothetical protein